jgi:FkbM family methyltransferase
MIGGLVATMIPKELIRKTYELMPSRMRSKLRSLLMRRLENFFVLRVHRGLLMDLDPWEWSQNQIRRNKTGEPLTIRLFERLLTTSDTYVDVGSHVGFHTLIARSIVGGDGIVLAVEPQPYNCAKILRNWHLNGFSNCIVYVAAAGDHDGPLMLHNQPSSDRSRLSVSAPSIPGDLPQRFCVSVRRLDGLMRENDLARAKLLKIDAEGHELNVVKGLGNNIEAVENILVEIWDPLREEYQELVQILKQRGFELRKVDGSPWSAGNELPEMNLRACRFKA